MIEVWIDRYVSELKMVDLIYFQFISYFHFIFHLFLFWEPELEIGITQYHYFFSPTTILCG